MNYFKILGIVFGLAAMLKPVYMHLIPWDENKFIEKTYAKERPPWVIAVGIIGLLLVAFTWYQHFTAEVPNSIILTVLFSLTAIKAIAFIFDYERFQKWVEGMLKKDKGKDIVLIDIAAGVIGLIIILLAVFLY